MGYRYDFVCDVCIADPIVSAIRFEPLFVESAFSLSLRVSRKQLACGVSLMVTWNICLLVLMTIDDHD